MKSKDISDVEYKINQDGRQASFVFPNGMKLVPILHNGYQEHQTQHSGPLDLYNLSGPWRGDFTQTNTQQTKTSAADPYSKSDYLSFSCERKDCFVWMWTYLDVVEMLKQYKGNYPFHHPISYKYYFTKYCLTFSVWLSFLLSKQHHNNCYLDIFSRYIYCTTLSSAAWLHSSLHCCSIATCGLLCPGCHCRHQHRWATVDSRMGTGKLRSWVAPPSHRVPQFRYNDIYNDTVMNIVYAWKMQRSSFKNLFLQNLLMDS